MGKTDDGRELLPKKRKKQKEKKEWHRQRRGWRTTMTREDMRKDDTTRMEK